MSAFSTAATASDARLLAVALDALPVVLELGAPAQELVLQLVALAAQRLDLLAGRAARAARRRRPRPLALVGRGRRRVGLVGLGVVLAVAAACSRAQLLAGSG